MIRNALRLMIVCAVGACTVAQPGGPEQVQGDAVDEIAAPSKEAVIPPTPEMLAAALSGDPDAMANAVRPNVCVAPSTCPAQFGSCAAWSTPSFCGKQCLSTLCEGGAEGRFGKFISNSFRVCFDAAGNSCTEWMQTSNLVCGC